MLKYAANLIEGIAGLVSDIITIVFVAAIVLACLRWLFA